MQTKDLHKEYPSKSFSEKFKEKKQAFVAIGANAAEFDSKESAISKVFEYDTVVSKLKSRIEKEEQIDDHIASDIKQHFQRVGRLCDLLEKLNTTQPSNAKIVFQQFDEELNRMGFIGSIVYKTSVGKEVRARESIVDHEIADVNRILQLLEPPEEHPVNDVDTEKIKEAEQLANKIIEEADKYKQAAEAAENWINTEGRAVSTSLKDKTKVFEDKAVEEHTGHYVWWWLVAATVFAVGAIISSLIFIGTLSGDGISIGAALLRVSVVAMFFYLSYLSYQQFSIQQKLYETYKFKAIALSTMEDLVKTYTEHNDREMIVSKAIEIIFSQPRFKEDKVAHQRMIDELIDILKKKM